VIDVIDVVGDIDVVDVGDVGETGCLQFVVVTVEQTIARESLVRYRVILLSISSLAFRILLAVDGTRQPARL
jgi:hypothetical protein